MCEWTGDVPRQRGVWSRHRVSPPRHRIRPPFGTASAPLGIASSPLGTASAPSAPRQPPLGTASSPLRHRVSPPPLDPAVLRPDVALYELWRTADYFFLSHTYLLSTAERAKHETVDRYAGVPVHVRVTKLR